MNAPTTQRAAVPEGNVFERWAALRPAADAPREPLALGCVRATGACSCEACAVLEADARTIRALVADTMIECGAMKATALLVRRGFFDAEALDAVREGCEDISESKNGPMRSLMLAWVEDLVAGRHDRIERSDAAWHRTDCVPCGRAAFDTAAPCCDRCAGEVTP